MSHISPNLRFLLSPLKPSLSFSSSLSSIFSQPKLRPISIFTVLAAAPSKRHRSGSYRQYSPNFTKRKKSTMTEIDGTDKEASMDKNESFGFNKKRALGMDKSDKPKRNLQLKTRKLNPSNTIAYVQILGTGMDTQDTSSSVLLFFDKQRFIFNAGEGLQRFCTEHKIKLSKIDHIFLSRVCSETANGLPGLLLTLAGMGDEGMTVNVWGPSDLKYLIEAMKCFIPRAAMVHTHSFGTTLSSESTVPLNQSNATDGIVLVDDEVVKISAVILRPSCSEGSTLQPGEMSVIYICELPKIAGKFDPEKAVALGLRRGPKYSELQHGISVKSDRLDIMVHPSDVMGASIPGPIVFLVDCPTLSHAEELSSIESLSNYYTDTSGNPTESTKTVNCVIHLSPPSVISSSPYEDWMKRFGTAQHIIAGHEMKNMEIPILKSSTRITGRLNYLCPQFFPTPGLWSDQHSSSLAMNSVVSHHCETISAENLLKFTLRPYANLGLDRSLVPSRLTPSGVISDLLLEMPEIEDAALHIKQLWNGQDNMAMIEEPWLDENSVPNCLENIRRDDMEIVLLGTGSSQPSKYRNVTSIYVNLFSKGSLLLDCGEGTLGQLKRRYGVEGADTAVKNLKCIWISHIHADHHSGLARILTLRRDLLKKVPHEPLFVVGPRQLKRFLDAYQRLEDLDMQFLDCRSTTEASWNSFEDDIESNKDGSNMNKNTKKSLFAIGSAMQSVWKKPVNPFDDAASLPYLKKLKKLLNEAGLDTLISFPVVHCPQAFGVVLKAADRNNSVGKVIPGWKFVYSGDTRPCPELVEASRGATVLIHEATFEDDLVEEAVARNHSTTKEAVEAGNSAGVYRIILTHFSQRYPKIPQVDETYMHKTCIGFDLMSINIADLPVLPSVVPYLRLLFRNAMVDESEDVIDAVNEAS